MFESSQVHIFKHTLQYNARSSIGSLHSFKYVLIKHELKIYSLSLKFQHLILHIPLAIQSIESMGLPTNCNYHFLFSDVESPAFVGFLYWDNRYK